MTNLLKKSKAAANIEEAFSAIRVGQADRAVRLLERALREAPKHFEALMLLGRMRGQQGRFGDAVALFERAAAARPDNIEAQYNLGVALTQLGSRDKAVACYQRVLRSDPRNLDAYNNLAAELLALKRAEEALSYFDKTLSIDPYNARALANRGIALKQLQRFEEAEKSLSAALRIRADDAIALFNLGGIFVELNRPEDAVRSYKQALAARPDMASARLALCVAELPVLYTDSAEAPRRRAAYEKALRQLRDDFDRDAVAGDFVEAIGSTQPFLLAYQGKNDRELQSIYGATVCAALQKRYPHATLARKAAPGEPLKLGIVSGIFKNHTIWKLATRGWISQLDRRRFHVTGYHTGATIDSETKVAEETCDRFVQGPKSIEDWRRVILADAPHALIYPEVGIDGTSICLSAQRLAPVQCNFWGHPETSGFPTLDYFLTSNLMEPPDGDEHYTEKLIRLPNLSIYYEPHSIPSLAMSRAELGLRSTSTAYWCGQSLFKYLPEFDEVYPRIAREVGDCQFVFIEYQSTRQITDLFLKRLDRAFALYGLDAAEHCVMLPRLDMRQFIAAIGVCDVILDSIGWSGGNTTLEGLSHALPIVTLPGSLMRGRHTTGILTMMGVTETVAPTVDDYIAIAVKLARDVAWRAAIKGRMMAQRHKVYRDTAPIRALEDFLENAIRSSCA
jgi:predicted O-linked N-acetylglucosamine transferase (SPINDLY family)